MSESLVTRLQTASRLLQSNRVPEAIAAYERVLAQWPDLPDCWYNLGLLQRRAGNLEVALSSYRRALALGVSAPEEVHLNCGAIFADQHQEEAAEREFYAALKLRPDYIPALLNLANLREDFGRRAEADELYRRVVALDPRCYQALARWANALAPLTSQEGSRRDDPANATHLSSATHSEMAVRLRHALGDPAASAAQKASLAFALGRLLDESGDFEGAFAAYRQANRESRASAGAAYRGYDRGAQEMFVERMRDAFPAASAIDWPAAGSAKRGAEPTPIFICGMFRSGSTLAERLLSGHPGVGAGGELGLIPALVTGPLRPFPDSIRSVSPSVLAAMSENYLREISRRYPGATYVTDKRPDNFLHIGLIKALFPSAKIVHTTRDPLDTCLSIYFLHLDHGMSYALDLGDIGHYYRQSQLMMAHWRALYPQDILDFDYDTFVRDPRPTAQRLFEFLGLTWSDAYLDMPAQGAVRTASVWQVREPIYQRSSGRARHYRAWLGDLRSELGDEPCSPR